MSEQKEKRYWTARWRRMRARVLSAEPWCRVCGAPANEVDHIQPAAQGGEFWDKANLQPLCKVCHATKTVADGRWGYIGRPEVVIVTEVEHAAALKRIEGLQPDLIIDAWAIREGLRCQASAAVAWRLARSMTSAALEGIESLTRGVKVACVLVPAGLLREAGGVGGV